MPLFDDPFPIARRQVGFQYAQITWHHFLKHRQAIGNQFWTNQVDVLLKHGRIQYRLRFIAINRRHGALLFITGVPELFDHGGQGRHRQRLAQYIIHTGIEILFFILQHVCRQRHQRWQFVSGIFPRQLAGNIQPGHIRQLNIQ